MGLFRRKRKVLDHPYFGGLAFVGGAYWEGELLLPGLPDKVGIIVPAPETGPVATQVDFCERVLGDLDTLFARCRPVFEAPFEQWTGKALPGRWSDAFVLVGLGLPARGDPAEPWDVCYFVADANHYFTAYFEAGEPCTMSVDG